MSELAKRLGILSLLTGTLALSACEPRMTNEGRLRPFAPSGFFANGALAQHPVDGTVAADADPALSVFKDAKTGDYRRDFPLTVDGALIRRGQNRFEIYCSPCHGLLADGKGPVVTRGFLPPPSLHDDFIRGQANGFYFEVITNGFGAMFAYSDRLSPRDRWAVVSYIRTLQLATNFKYEDLGPDEKPQLPPKPEER